MAHVYWTDRGEESVLAIGRHIIEQTQSRQRGLDVIARIEEKCARYAEFPEAGTSRSDIGPDVQNPDYTLLQGDLSSAYSKKVRQVLRSFVFLNLRNPQVPAAMVVFDRVVSTD